MPDLAAVTPAPPRRVRSWLLILLIGVVAATGGVSAYFTDLWPRLENDTLAMRYQLRPTSPPDDIAVVAIDDVTFDENGHQQWPFPRSQHGKVIDQLSRAGARQIVYDVQFTEMTTPREDLALYEAVARARNVVLATTETAEPSIRRRKYIEGLTRVLGGERNLRPAGAEAASANLPTDEGGAIQRFDHSYGGVQTLAVTTARRATGRPVPTSAFGPRGAWIDFRGPPGTIETLSFSRVMDGNFDRDSVRGKIVVVGAAHQTLQDVHATPTAGHELMSGPEIQANAVWTALHGMPLRSVPAWMEVLIIVALALFPFIAGLRLRPLAALLVSVAVGAAFAAGSYLAFTDGFILAVTYPLAALGLGTVGMVVVGYVAERYERRVVASINEVLEDRVAERTEEVRATQLELISRLGRAAERRDTDTGEHIERMSYLCARVGRDMGMSAEESETFRHAAAMHDIGKIGIPDRVLLKEGALDAEEWDVMRTHTVIGADVLANSPSPLLQMAETVARTHHERWDGTGYPAGLSGEDIPLVGRICAICDAFDALTSRRPYKEPWPIADALKELREQRGRHFDPAVVDAFFALDPMPEPADVPVPRVPAHDPDPTPA
jgi:CHASE2 domain-containing sensor protein